MIYSYNKFYLLDKDSRAWYNKKSKQKHVIHLYSIGCVYN